MGRARTWTVLAGAIGLIQATGAEAAATAPIDCRRAQGPVSGTICASPEYRAMDREIAALTDRALAESSPGDRSLILKARAHFLEQRAGCAWASHNSAHPGAALDECIRASLEGRVQSLRVLVERGSSLARAR